MRLLLAAIVVEGIAALAVIVGPGRLHVRLPEVGFGLNSDAINIDGSDASEPT